MSTPILFDAPGPRGDGRCGLGPGPGDPRTGSDQSRRHAGADATEHRLETLLRAAAEAELHDTCLWTALAVATGAQGNSTALVGTPETVAKALLEYYKLGAKVLTAC